METPLPTHHQFILDSIAEGVFTVDSEFKITSFNKAAETIVGVSREQALGKKCFDLFQANICHRACAVKKTLETGESQQGVRVDIRNYQGELVPEDRSLYPGFRSRDNQARGCDHDCGLLKRPFTRISDR